jgi:hypothetical protein
VERNEGNGLHTLSIPRSLLGYLGAVMKGLVSSSFYAPVLHEDAIASVGWHEKQGPIAVLYQPTKIHLSFLEFYTKQHGPRHIKLS